MEKSTTRNADWESVKQRIKEAYTSITDADLEFIPGKEDELYNRLGQKLQKNKDQVRAWIESLAVNKSMAG
jgi:uncharacterized protein YjbJ (UPF0337 family)